MPLFSIVVVSFNTKKQFLKTINSIKKQKFKNYEIIIVDGKSDDGTINEIKKIKNKKIKSIIEKDKGIYDAMNKGVTKSLGDWVIFLNSGDTFYNCDVLKKISLKKIKNYEILYGNTVINNDYFNYTIKAQNFTKTTFLMPFCHQSTVTKRKILLKSPFSLKYQIASDFEFFVKNFTKKVSFHNLNFVISKISSNGLSDKKRNIVYDENIKIITNYNPNFSLVIKLKINKILFFSKKWIKFLLPNSLNLYILKLKYNKNNQ
jgi:glycosyltransferase involved in cell wall biosynthesis